MTIQNPALGRTTAMSGVSALAIWFAANLAPAYAQDTAATDAPDDIIVVTATRTALNLADAPASLSVVTAEDIELSAAVDTLDAIRQTPGISFQGRGVGGRQVLSIRGMGSDQTLFMIDGRRTVSSDNVFGHSNYQYNWLPMSSVERIEVVRGPLSALYGSEALGGVVNIITKSAPDDWSGTASARYSFADNGGDQQYATLQAAGPVGENAGLLFSLTFDDQGDVPLAEDIRLSELEGKQAFSGYARFSWQAAENHRFDYDLSMTTEDRFRDTDNRGTPPYHESSYDLDKLHYGASYSGSFGEIDARLNFYQSELEQINHASAGVVATNPQTLEDRVLDGHLIIPAGTSHRFVVGGELRDETLIHPAIAAGQVTTLHQALFLQDEWSLSENLRLTVGARFDDHEIFGSEISPRAYLVYHVNDVLTIKGGFGHGFRAPTIKQSSPDYLFLGFHSFVGNAAVDPETSDNFELGLTYETNGMRFATTAFVNQVDDLIATQCIVNCTTPFGRLYTYVNVSEAETRGLESEFEYQVSDRFTVRATHVYMDSEDGSTGLALAERPEHTFNARLSWHAAEQGVTTMLRAEYIGEQVEYTSTGAALDMPGYTLWHLNGSWNLQDAWQLTYGVRNIGDLRLAEESTNYGYAERGRSVYVGARRTF
jgi:outer membrane receptor for ferrienterochelin and colicins